MFELKTVMFKVLCSRETILSGETVLQMDILIGTMCYTDWEKKKKKRSQNPFKIQRGLLWIDYMYKSYRVIEILLILSPKEFRTCMKT